MRAEIVTFLLEVGCIDIEFSLFLFEGSNHHVEHLASASASALFLPPSLPPSLMRVCVFISDEHERDAP